MKQQDWSWIRLICWLAGMFIVAAGSYTAIVVAQAEQAAELAIIREKVERIERHLGLSARRD